MNQSDETIYRLMIVIFPILLGILSFVGIMAVNWLKHISNALENMNVKLEKLISNHENLEKRVDKIEEKIAA